TLSSLLMYECRRCGPVRSVLCGVHHMSIRRLCVAGFLVVGTANAPAAQRTPPVRFPTSHGRDGTLPPLVTTRGDVERLITQMLEMASALDPVDTVDGGELTMMLAGRDAAGRYVSSTLPASKSLDTLRRYLD